MVVDTTAANPDLNVVVLLADSEHEARYLGPIRQAFTGDPRKMSNNITKRCSDRLDFLGDYMSQVEETSRDNPKQKEVVESLTHVHDKLLAIVGH